MNCTKVQALLHGYVDNELELPTVLDLEAHLESCGDCRQELEQLTHLQQVISQKMDYQRAPASLNLRLQKITQPTKTDNSSFKNAWRAWVSFKPAVAFMLLVLLVGVEYQLRTVSAVAQISDEIVAGHIRSLMAEHLTDVASSDQHTVKPWFNGKIDFSPQVVDLTAQGFPLVGGRLDYFADRQVIALVYRRRQHLINVFIWPENVLKIQADYDTNKKGFNLIAFQFQNMRYWIVSDLNRNELIELKNELVRH
jgi:anti-sigma factor RsiW